MEAKIHKTNRTALFKPQMLMFLALIIILQIGCKETSRSPSECTDRTGCVDIPAGDPVQIGVLQALTGEAVSLGLEQIRGIELAVDARKGKLLGRDIVIQKEDAGCTSEGGANGALKLSSDPKVVGVIGTTCSAAAASAAEILSDAGTVMISGNNSAPFMTSVGGRRAPNWQEGYFRTANNEENAGKAAAKFAIEKLGVEKSAAVNDGDIYTRGLTNGFESEFEKLGGSIVLSATVNKGDEDMTPVLEAVEYSGAELLFFPLFQPEGNRILIQARKNPRLDNVVMMSDGALIEATFIERVKENGKGMYFVGPAVPETDASRELRAKYIARFRAEPLTGYYLSAFDAASLLFNAIERTAIREPDGSLRIRRDALRRSLYSVDDFEGVTGILDCDEFGDCAFPRFSILRLDDPSKGLAGLQTNVVYNYSQVSKK